MAKHRSSDSTSIRPKIFPSANEISQGIEKLRGRIIQVEELKKDGLPYRDALKVTTEYQVRDTIKEVFGKHSPEFHEHQHHRIKVSSKAGVDETVSLLHDLVLALEEKRLQLLGLLPAVIPKAHANGHAAGDQPTAEPSPSVTPQAAEPAPVPPTPQAPIELQPAAAPVQAKEAAVPASRPMPPSHTAPPTRSAGQSTDSLLVSTDVAPSNEPLPTPQPRHKMRLSAAVRAKDTAREGMSMIPRTVSHPDVSLQEIPSPELPSVTAPEPSPIPPRTSLKTSIPSPDEYVPQPVLAVTDSHTDMKGEVPMLSAPDPASVQVPATEVQKTDSEALTIIRNICTRFHSVARQLRQRGDDRPTLEVEDEIDVQDVLQTLLCSQFDDIQTEPWNPSYANGMPRTDLILKQDGIVIVVKKTRQGIGGKTLTEQLSVDVQRYLNHPLCKTLLCFIYDPEGRVGNPGSLQAALMRQQNGRRVEVLISPK